MNSRHFSTHDFLQASFCFCFAGFGAATWPTCFSWGTPPSQTTSVFLVKL